MKQQLRALDVTQKPIAQTCSSVSAFDQSGDIGNNKRAKVSEIDDTQMRFQRRKRIVSNLRMRGRYCRNERRLSCVWKTDQTNVCEQLQFELQVQLFSLASALVIARCAVCRSREVRVSKSAAPASCCQPAIAVVAQVV